MGDPLVSIIVPVYNTEEYVEECIQSILSQSYENIELILVNDGSTDDSGEICRRYSQRHNVKYIKQENRGVVATRKHGVEAAKGEWIMFVDSDDCLFENCVDELYALSDGVDIVVGRSTRNQLLKDAPPLVYYEKEEYLNSLFCQRIPLASWAKLFKKELIDRCLMAFAYKLPMGEDYIMNLALARVNKKKVAVWKKPVYFYRDRLESAIHSCSYELDYCYNLCNIMDSVLVGSMNERDMNYGKILNRLVYYQKYLVHHGMQGNKSHPLVKDIVHLMNKEKYIRLSDRLILYVSDRRAMIFCYLLRKAIKCIEHPSLIIREVKRLYSYLFQSNKRNCLEFYENINNSR